MGFARLTDSGIIPQKDFMLLCYSEPLLKFNNDAKMKNKIVIMI